MARQAKVFARVFNYQVPAELPAGQMKITVEWKRLLGGRQAGKTTFVVDDLSGDDKLLNDLREKLADALSVQFSPEVFKPRDIIGYGI